MNTAYRTFILWMIWGTTAVVVYLGLYIDTDILSFLKHDQSRITWIITVLFLIGILASFILVVVITGERIEASIQDDIAKDKGLMALEPSRRKQKSVNRFYDSLKTVAKSNEKPNIEVLLDMELSSYFRMSHAIEVLGNLLITLGLIGTVVGLTLTLSGLTSSLDALGQDQDLLLSGLRKAMGGMGTAFYTTLLGAVLGGVLMRIFALITEHGVGGLQDQLMKTCMVHCSADFKQSAEKDIRFLNVEIDALGIRVKTLEKTFDDSRIAINAFRDSIRELHQLSGDDSGVYSLRETLKMQKYYRILLRQEMHLMHRLNQSWWHRFKDFLATRKD